MKTAKGLCITAATLSFSAAGVCAPDRWQNGLGEPTATGIILGTAQYMSPEQALGRQVDPPLRPVFSGSGAV